MNDQLLLRGHRGHGSLVFRGGKWLLQRSLAALVIRACGLVFLGTALSKIADPSAASTSLEWLGFAGGTVRIALFILIVVESTLGMWMVLTGGYLSRLVRLGTVLLLLGFSGFIGYLLTQQDAPSCGCAARLVRFDSVQSENLASLTRNGLMITGLILAGGTRRAVC